MSSRKLTVVVAAPLSASNGALITSIEPRVELIHRPDLLPPQRHPGDFEGDPTFVRSRTQQAEFDALVASAEGLYGIPDLDPSALKRAAEANPRLVWVHTMAAGGGSQVRAAGLTAEQLERIAFTTSAGVHGEALAEFALFGVLAGAKSLPRLLEQQRERVWSGRWMMGQIREQTVLVLGLGGIGSQVAQKLSALGAQVIGTSRRDRHAAGVDRIIHPDQLKTEIGGVDAVVVSLPGTDVTAGMVDAELLSHASDGLTVVNVGRGVVVVERDLIAGLKSGRVGFAALDVFEQEPLDPDSELWRLPNVLVSPHTAGLTAREDEQIARLFARNATRLIEGKELLNRVDVVEFY